MSSLTFSQSDYLTILTHAPAESVKALAEQILPHLNGLRVLVNRTGLVMLPYTDTAQGTVFHLGEVLVTESHVVIDGDIHGYAVCTGRDLVQSLAVAVLDVALSANIEVSTIQTFLQEQQQAQTLADETLLRKVESTRVEMETF